MSNPHPVKGYGFKPGHISNPWGTGGKPPNRDAVLRHLWLMARSSKDVSAAKVNACKVLLEHLPKAGALPVAQGDDEFLEESTPAPGVPSEEKLPAFDAAPVSEPPVALAAE